MKVRVMLEDDNGRAAQWAAEVAETWDERGTIISVLGAVEHLLHITIRDLHRGEPLPWTIGPTRRTPDE